MLLALFCGICVSDYDIAAEWYVHLLGGEPSFIPNDIEAVWDLADNRSIYLVVRPEGAGHSVVAIFVDDLSERVAGIAERAIQPTKQETYDNGVRRSSTPTPTGTRSRRRSGLCLLTPARRRGGPRRRRCVGSAIALTESPGFRSG